MSRDAARLPDIMLEWDANRMSTEICDQQDKGSRPLRGAWAAPL